MSTGAAPLGPKSTDNSNLLSIPYSSHKETRPPDPTSHFFELFKAHQAPKTQEQLNLEEARKELGVRTLGSQPPESFGNKCVGVAFVAIPVIVAIGAILGLILPLYYGGII